MIELTNIRSSVEGDFTCSVELRIQMALPKCVTSTHYDSRVEGTNQSYLF